MEPIDYSEQAGILRVINSIPIFSGLGLAEQHLLADKFSVMEFHPGEIIIEQGAAGDRLYAIDSGRVLVSRNTQSRGWVKVNILGPGDIFGEIAILRKIPRTARITTETACKFLSINAHDFLEVYQYFPQQARDNIQLVIAKRLAELDDEKTIGRVHTSLR